MATLEGVMRTEFGEGLTLEGAADEASIEVVVPDRTLLLRRRTGPCWKSGACPWIVHFYLRSATTQDAVTLSTGVGAFGSCVTVEHAGHRSSAAVVAPLAPIARFS